MPSFDPDWLNQCEVNLDRVQETCSNILRRRCVKGVNQAAWQLRAVTCLDLTSLNSDDTPSTIFRLCSKAVKPLSDEIVSQLQTVGVRTAAVCVYPPRVKDCVDSFETLGVRLPIAAVASGFPSGQYSIGSRLDEIRFAVESGADEIDVVINRTAAHRNDWETVFNELCEMKEACGSAHMKVILSTGELGSLKNVRKASLTAMQAGADFIKTSTGKESVNANYPVTLTMLRAISDYYRDTQTRVGFKPAGGIRTAKDALDYQLLVNEVLGKDWLKNDLFRIGASGLLSDIERQLFFYATKRYANASDLAPC
ncbi:deoxyribose-phosphate aldolase isoform X2 [Galendromus occidentalis]|nr:deoxyribose-phosphate aldolase isoform X2 [Galendromus occidentalis]